MSTQPDSLQRAARAIEEAERAIIQIIQESTADGGFDQTELLLQLAANLDIHRRALHPPESGDKIRLPDIPKADSGAQREGDLIDPSHQTGGGEPGNPMTHPDRILIELIRRVIREELRRFKAET